MSPLEYELDATMTRSGRVRRAQFRRTMRWQAVPPSQRGDMPFEAPQPSSNCHGEDAMNTGHVESCRDCGESKAYGCPPCDRHHVPLLKARVAELEKLRDRVFDLVLEANMVRTPALHAATLLGRARDAILDDREKRPAPTASVSTEPVVWANDATPFTGPQVLDLLRENEALRVRLAASETGKIVAWLRTQQASLQKSLDTGGFSKVTPTYSIGQRDLLDELAERIERGEHAEAVPTGSTGT